MLGSDLYAALLLHEADRGYELEADERQVIAGSRFAAATSAAARQIVLDWLETVTPGDDAPLESAYWTLARACDPALLPVLRAALRRYVGPDIRVAYQIMVGLDALHEPVFGRDRRGYGFDEDDLNRRDALAYLARLDGEDGI